MTSGRVLVTLVYDTFPREFKRLICKLKERGDILQYMYIYTLRPGFYKNGFIKIPKLSNKTFVPKYL